MAGISQKTHINSGLRAKLLSPKQKISCQQMTNAIKFGYGECDNRNRSHFCVTLINYDNHINNNNHCFNGVGSILKSGCEMGKKKTKLEKMTQKLKRCVHQCKPTRNRKKGEEELNQIIFISSHQLHWNVNEHFTKSMKYQVLVSFLH